MALRCRHARVARLTEADGCSWLRCCACGARGRRCHSVTMALRLWPHRSVVLT